MGTAGTSRDWRSCSSLPCQTSCGSSDGSRGERIFLGAFSSSATKSRSSSAGMLARLSLCLVARTGVGDLDLGGMANTILEYLVTVDKKCRPLAQLVLRNRRNLPADCDLNDQGLK